MSDGDCGELCSCDPGDAFRCWLCCWICCSEPTPTYNNYSDGDKRLTEGDPVLRQGAATTPDRNKTTQILAPVDYPNLHMLRA